MNSQTIGIIIILSLAYFLASMLMTRAYSDTQLITNYQTQATEQYETIDYLTGELYTSTRLNDILYGRLLQMYRVTEGKVDESLDTYKRILDQTEEEIKLRLEETDKYRGK
jgi:hypothetical protein